MKKLLLGIVLPAILLIAGYAMYKIVPAPVPPQRELPDPTQVAELLPFVPIADVAEVYDLRKYSETLNINVNGTVVPFRELNIAAEVAGRIIEKNPQVRSGNFIEKDEVLFKIDPRDYELEVQRLTRQLEREQAALAELDQDIVNSTDLLDVTQQQLELAKREVTRLEGLNRNVASQAELDAARQSVLTSKNAVVTQNNQVRTFKTRRGRLEIAIQLAETQLEQAELSLSRCVVKAPADGRVVMDQVEVDSFVQRGTQLLSLEDTEKVEIACNLRMDQLFWVLDQPGLSSDQLLNAAQASRHDLPETPVAIHFKVTGRDSVTYRWRGVIDRYEGAGIDPQSRTVPIRIVVDKPAEYEVLQRDSNGVELPQATDAAERRGPPMLVRGMFVDLSIQPKPTTPLLLIPKLSIKPSSPNNVVWKFGPNPEAVFATPTAVLAQKAAKEAAEGAGAPADGSPTAPQKNEAETKPDETRDAQADSDGDGDDAPASKEINAEDWRIGYLEVVQGVRMISEFWLEIPEHPGKEYWVCEVEEGLDAGDLVITTPLPGIRADGSDPVRYHLPAEETSEASSVAETPTQEQEVSEVADNETVVILEAESE